ncbi:MAG: NAD-dependent succinate-semialdehyde dehydrogenase [Streptosporangiaceae bacterium]|jgi:succinate-semialdehyde dehydrogenase/glutarate-semialdehyde dehydrogenase
MTYPSISLYIDGEWSEGKGGRADDVINPATGEAIGRVPFAEPEDTDRAIDAAAAAFPAWRDAGPDKRGAILRRAAGLIHERADEIGRVMSLEEGKILNEGVNEAHRAAGQLEVYVEEAKRAYGRIIPTDPSQVLSVRKEPVGPVGAFVPWNFPAGGPMRKMAAALAAGCSIVIKPSEETPGTAYLLARAFADAGLPAGVLNMLFGVPDEISRRVIAAPAIRYIAFTGSVPVGKHIAGLTAEVMKHATMELGGHAPVIVCADTDVTAAAKAGAAAKVFGAGQVCTSPSRFLVDRRILPQFTATLVEELRAVKVGDPLEDGVRMGPLANGRRRDAVHTLVTDAVSRGATALTGGQLPDGPGFFYPPTVLTDVPPDAAVLHDEPFGPIAPVVGFDDLDEALAVANSLPYGLAAYGFTDSAATAEKLIGGFEAGILSINHCGGSVPNAPSGGVKESGYGKEGGPEGLAGYQISKRVSHRLRP